MEMCIIFSIFFIKAVNYGNPHENEFARKYLNLPLEEKRKLYSCRNNYEKLEDLVLWPALWKFQKKYIQFKGKFDTFIFD